MSPSDLLEIAAGVLVTVWAAFIVYRAVRLRSALIDRIYRARALWTAVGGLTVFSLLLAEYIDTVFGQTPNTITGVLVEDLFWGFTFIGLYLWIASNITVALSADFFNRDALMWRKAGRFITPLAVFSTYFLFSLPPWWVPETLNTGGLVSNILTFIVVAVVVYAAATMALISFRIKDRVTRSYTKWVALSVLATLLIIAVSASAASAFVIVPALIWGYCMYRSVGSLAIRMRTLPS
jgi:hypothetical protein